VQIDIFNLNGELVNTLVQGVKEAGTHQVTWDGTNRAGETVASGTYIYTLKSEHVGLARQMVFMK